MLLWCESDPATKLAVLYLESFGNPRKFARTARRVGRTEPVLIVNLGRSAAGRRLAAARAAAAVAPPLTRQALLEQAGVIAAANLGELLDTAALLASQPVPRGHRVAVVSNTRGGGVLAADACGDAGLRVAGLAQDTRAALRARLPPGAEVAGPVSTTAAIAPGLFRRCLELAGADPGVDAVLALTAATATSDLVPEVQAARPPVPIAATVMDQVEAVRLLPGPGEAESVKSNETSGCLRGLWWLVLLGAGCGRFVDPRLGRHLARPGAAVEPLGVGSAGGVEGGGAAGFDGDPDPSCTVAGVCIAIPECLCSLL